MDAAPSALFVQQELLPAWPDPQDLSGSQPRADEACLTPGAAQARLPDTRVPDIRQQGIQQLDIPALHIQQSATPSSATQPSNTRSPGVRSAPQDLHPDLWQAWQLSHARHALQPVLPSGHAELDAQLPGGGWPARVLTELLLPHAGIGELRLLAPALAALQAQQRGLMWFDPPASPCAWALGDLGIDVRQLVLVRSRSGLKGRARQLLPAADVLWALEQALKSGHLGAVLAWLPAQLPADALRRLQLAAQGHDGPVFLLRDTALRHRPSAAPLRLLLSSAGPDLLRVGLLKRRGPPLAQPLTLALPPVLSAAARARVQVMPAAASNGVRRAVASTTTAARSGAWRP